MQKTRKNRERLVAVNSKSSDYESNQENSGRALASGNTLSHRHCKKSKKIICCNLASPVHNLASSYHPDSKSDSGRLHIAHSLFLSLFHWLGSFLLPHAAVPRPR